MSWNCAYPEELDIVEGKLLDQRRKALKQDAGAEGQAGQKKEPKASDVPNRVGFGLSGGGIRSATFCLGLFQALAKENLLSNIDYLSTVSGGGYFGSFYGRLFARNDIIKVEDAENVLKVRDATQEGEEPETKVFRWLRENGRYLAPNGAGDVLLAGATAMRNWMAIQIVLGTLVLALCLLAQLARGVVEAGWHNPYGSLWQMIVRMALDYLKMPAYLEFMAKITEATGIWWSPYTILPVVALVVCVIPTAWGYWIIEKPDRKDAGRWISPWVGLVSAIVIAISILKLAPEQTHETLVKVVWIVLVLSVLTGIWVVADCLLGADDEKVRNLLSRQLRFGLKLAGVLLAIALIDSMAQTAYAAFVLGRGHIQGLTAGLISALVGLAGLARKLLGFLGFKSDGQRLGVPYAVAAAVGAILVAAASLIVIDGCSYAIAWDTALPIGYAPKWVAPPATPEKLFKAVERNGVYGLAEVPSAPCTPGTTPNPGKRDGIGDLYPLFWAAVITFFFSYLFGRSWAFLNRSTLHPLYASRLIRAYLGASNPDRLKATSQDVTEVIPGDDLKQEEYWPLQKPPTTPTWLQRLISPVRTWLHKPETGDGDPPEPRAIYDKGGPLHIVNVTINETLDGRSATEQYDRKGIGMAVGPAAISAGVRHHVVYNIDKSIKIFPVDGSFRMFGDEPGSGDKPKFNGERLSLGNWTAISGAAVDTGLGSRTSLGLSFLAGWCNVRLGYWWCSGVAATREEATESSKQGWAGRMLARIFTVQTYLLYEMLARFHGAARKWWHLTDGGHFENMGGYELVRRRLPLIVIVDGEADPDYSFEGLANLVRKARLDFGAEIEFLNQGQLDQRITGSIRKYFGTLEQLRRGRWKQEPVTAVDVLAANRDQRLLLDRTDETARSMAYASLATVSYCDDSKLKSVLLYIKPCLIGEEPTDVRRYHTEHPSFPQETTAEQFFDEAQWESYRKLGEHIGSVLFQDCSELKKAAESPVQPFGPRGALRDGISQDAVSQYLK